MVRVYLILGHVEIITIFYLFEIRRNFFLKPFDLV